MTKFVTVRDATGREHHVPLRPDGAYITALARSAERRDAQRPLQQLLAELSTTTADLHELRRAFTRQ